MGNSIASARIKTNNNGPVVVLRDGEHPLVGVHIDRYENDAGETVQTVIITQRGARIHLDVRAGLQLAEAIRVLADDGAGVEHA